MPNVERLSWEELRSQTVADSALIEGWRGVPGSMPIIRPDLLSAIKFITATVVARSRLRRLTSWRSEELVLFLLQQAYLNQRASAELTTSHNLFFGPHNQLPCTPESLEARMAVISQYVPTSEPILIIGDDDLQSLSLARRGFSDVTVVEIDARIADYISDISRAEGLGIRVICQNIEKSGIELARPYRATLIDPPTDREGLRAFLAGVFRTNVRETGYLLFLNTNLLAHQRGGYEALRSSLCEAQFILRERLIGTNTYSLPRIPKALLRFGIRLVMPALARRQIQFYCADLMVLECRGS